MRPFLIRGGLSRWALGALIALLPALLVPRATLAARPDPAAAEARAHFERGERAFNLGRFEEALLGYEAAYEAKPLPGLLFNIAQCHRNMDRPERAIFFYERYLALAPEAANRPLIEKLIAQMRARLLAHAQAEPTSPASARPASRDGPPPSPRLAPTSGTSAASVAGPALELPKAEPARPASQVDLTPRPPEPAVDLTGDRAAASAAPVYTRWWFWGGVAAVVAGGVVTALALRGAPSTPSGALETIDKR